MRFDYGEKQPERLGIASYIAERECVMPEHCIMLYENLLRSHHSGEAAMGILATRSGILGSLCAAYVLGEDQLFNACASILLSNAESLARVVNQPCILGVELGLSIRLADTRVSERLADSILKAPNEVISHPEDAKAVVLAMILTGQRERVSGRLASLATFSRLNSDERTGWGLWLDLALSLKSSDSPSLAKIVAHEERMVRLELSRLARDKESSLCSFDLVSFTLEALRQLLEPEGALHAR